jgi:predicted small secreted protein
MTNHYSNTEKEKEKRMKDSFFKWGLIIILALIVAFVLTGCNTMAGLGKDISAAAKGIQDRISVLVSIG